MTYRIGIDVGGTNTDAVVLDDELRVLAAIKTPTTPNPADGVELAIDKVLDASGIDPHQVGHAMLGTTHCTNAIVERRNLSRVGVVRLGLPATTAVPPMEGWPADLAAAIGPHRYVLDGGYEIDGRAIRNIDPVQLREACAEMRGHVDSVAVIGVFAPMDNRQEIEAAAIIDAELGVPVTQSADLGSIGLLERENAAILNAALVRTLGDMLEGFRSSLTRRGITAEIYLGQNDGTLMQLDYALKFPVFTIGCGPTNSIRGAAHLSEVRNALVVDIGGTTTDIGMLVNGFPRQSAQAAEIGQIRTNFRMPDVLSVGLGGGTIIRHSDATVTLGPDSVGYRISTEALVFGGQTLTATDIAAAAGRFAPHGANPPAVDPAVLATAEARIREILEESIDKMKPSAAPMTVILVGGGSVIAPDRLDGVSEVIRPAHFGAANAVGAALGDIAGQFERIYPLASTTKAEARLDARNQAIQRAIAAGADPESVTVLEVEELPLAYVAEASLLIRAKAAGKLTRRLPRTGTERLGTTRELIGTT